MNDEIGRPTLLLNWVYYHPVGHAVEALKVAKGYRDANRGLRVSVLLNARTAVELAEACPWIERAYPIDTREVEALGADAPCLRAVPRTWDYVVADERVVMSPFPFSSDLRAFHVAADEYFQARRWKGPRFGEPVEGAPRYRLNATIGLRVPAQARRFAARYRHDGPKIAVLPAGSSAETIYPPLRWWTRLLRGMGDAFPSGRFYVTGVSGDGEGRSTTYAYPRESLDRLFRACSEAVDCYDIGLWNQLALIEQCDLLIAPHTGFAFLALCVGTPWLAISGVRWPEYFFNETPFYSVLPACRRYPCGMSMKAACVTRLERKRPVPCMDTRQLNSRIPAVVAGARLLLDAGFTYDEAVALYRRRIAEAGSAHERIFSFDGALPLD